MSLFTAQEKKNMSEADIRSKFISPAINNAGWSARQIREEYYFTDGRFVFYPKKQKEVMRKEGKKADYLLSYQTNLPLAVVEAKDNKHSLRSGLQQAIDYARILDIPFAYSSNGDGFIEYDFLTGVERELPLEDFPSPGELWRRYSHQYTAEQLKMIQQPYYTDVNKPITPRYYQQIAINKTVEAVAKGQQRILLVMATGTGKTYTAFQIIHRLKSVGAKKKILFLADRNILVDQPMREDFSPFKKVMTKVNHKTLDSSYEIYMALYQQLDGEKQDEALFKQFQPSFFDLIVIDECHRGSAKEDSAWRAILDYFNEATHIGMTATPKETVDASNITYFGEPIYTYSLKQGIEDGFLAPYRVIRVGLDCDLMGWRPPKGFKDINGQDVEDRLYTIKDFDNTIISQERTELVAKRICEFLRKTDPLQKTIVFCANIDHASRMCSALAKFSADMLQKNPKYIRQITGDQMGKQADLEAFCEVKNEKEYPVIAVTSKLMTTGVNSQMCKLVVLDANIGSMTEFKQIIGRGTRLRPNEGKTHFTIMDFRGVTQLFADPNFDGEPAVVLDVTGDHQPIPDPDKPNIPSSIDGENDVIQEPHPPYVIESGIGSHIIKEQEQYLNEKGELVTETFNDLSRQAVLKNYQTFELFKQHYAEDKTQFSHKWLKQLREVNHFDQDTPDDEIIGKIVYGKPTKKDRVTSSELIKTHQIFTALSEEKKQILSLVLEEHIKLGTPLTELKILQTPPFQQFGGIKPIIQNQFGTKDNYQQIMSQVEETMYTDK
ncbi:EcoAI/FtnUII family type I restriction enzme subunit R [Pasteurella multocida]